MNLAKVEFIFGGNMLKFTDGETYHVYNRGGSQGTIVPEFR